MFLTCCFGTHFFYSCYGQTLTVSTFIGETLYAILLAVVGLVLFAHLIGKVQVLHLCYMQYEE
jgi:hypothetical protein